MNERLATLRLAFFIRCRGVKIADTARHGCRDTAHGTSYIGVRAEPLHQVRREGSVAAGRCASSPTLQNDSNTTFADEGLLGTAGNAESGIVIHERDPSGVGGVVGDVLVVGGQESFFVNASRHRGLHSFDAPVKGTLSPGVYRWVCCAAVRLEVSEGGERGLGVESVG